MEIILASQSPRRKQLLASIVPEFKVQAANIDETPKTNETPYNYVKRLALEKAKSATRNSSNVVVIGSDTSVVIDGEILGKPVDNQDAQRMLMQLSNRTHQVMTSFSLVTQQLEYTEVVITDVTFTELNSEVIEQYWQTGEPQDKAGSYAIQGIGGRFVEKINGSVSSVIGLPLVELEKAMKEQL